MNIARRHLTKGQQAMVAAKALKERLVPNQRAASCGASVSQPWVAKAAVVLENAPDLADGVIAGSAFLDKAYETARERKLAAENKDAQMATVRSDAPDLAVLITEERMSLADAVAVNITRRHLKKSQTAIVVARSQKFGLREGATTTQKEAAAAPRACRDRPRPRSPS